MCGIVGVVAHTPVNQLLYDGLLLLQHRGQDAAGIVTSEGPVFHMYKAPGLRAERVPHAQHARPARAPRASATAATRPPASAFSDLESQPFYVNSPFGITLGHNGNLTNSEALKRELFQLDFRHVNTNSDSEVLLNVLALELERAAQPSPAGPGRDLPRGRRRAPALPRRLRDRRDDRRLRPARVPRSVRHPAAVHRRQRDGAAAASTSSPASRSRSRRSASGCCATSSRARRSSSTMPGAFHSRQCADDPAAACPASSSTSTSRGPIR